MPVSLGIAQTNSPVICRSIIEIPTDGSYPISLEVSTTNTQKVITIEKYQTPLLILIAC